MNADLGLDALEGSLPDAAKEGRALLEPFRYLASIPGKGVRSMLIQGFNGWLKLPEEKLQRIAKVIAMLHTASLVIDDIEDSSRLRRGVPTAHTIYGVPASVNSANMVYFLALKECALLDAEEGPSSSRADAAKRIFVEEMTILHRGQGCDIFWRDSSQCPTEEEYVQMVLDKTGGLFRLAVRLMIQFSDVANAPTAAAKAAAAAAVARSNVSRNDPASGSAAAASSSDSLSPEVMARLIPLVEYLGIYFQIRDDYINLASEKYHENKSFCEDFTEGKFSFPIIHHIRSDVDNHQVAKILQQRTEDVELKRYALSLLRASGSLDHCRNTLTKYEELIWDLLDGLPPNKLIHGIVLKLTNLEE